MLIGPHNTNNILIIKFNISNIYELCCSCITFEIIIIIINEEINNYNNSSGIIIIKSSSSSSSKL